MMNRRSGWSKHRLHRVVAYGKVRMWVLVVLVAGTALIAAFAAGRRAGPDAASTGANVVAQAGAPASMASHLTTFAAPANDSLRTAIFDSSTAVVAPGATLSIGPGIITPNHAHQWNATLSGTARIAIGGSTKAMFIRGSAGSVLLNNGTFEVRATPDTFLVHTIAGTTPWLYKPHGLFAWIPRHVPPDDVGVADNAHWKMRVTKSH